MLVSIYLSLLGLALILVIAGYYVNIKVLALVGTIALFFLGLVMSAGTITYKVGYNITEPCNCSLDQDAGYYLKTTQVVDTYAELNDGTSGWFGKYLAFAGALAFVLVIISNRGRGARD